MPIQTVTKKDAFLTWIEKTNLIPDDIGVRANLNTTDKDSLVDAIIELEGNNAQMLFGWFDDKSPQLYDDLDLNGNDIMGVGNIDINGTLWPVNITSGTIAVTQDQSDSSTKIATTEFADLKIATEVPNTSWGGDVSGFSPNLQINGNTVGMVELGGSPNTLVGTDGSGNIDFINISGGGDISGNITALEINANTVGITELNVNDPGGSGAGHVIVTEGGVQQLNFKPFVELSSVTPTVGDQTFNIDYHVGCILVYLNGIKLVNGHDFTANNGTSVSLTNAVSTANSTIDFQKFCM